MASLDDELARRLADLHSSGLYRELRCVDSAQSPRLLLDGKPLLNFSSNDYLGLADDPVLKEAAIHAIERFGAGAGASRLICGSLAVHHELDEAVAAFKGTPAAITFSTGYAAALGTICALLGNEDVIIIDKLVHACIVDAARLCGAKLRVFAHNDLDDLEDMLKWARERGYGAAGKGRALLVTESVFSMDGDQAPLRQLVQLKQKYGAWLMVDEAHTTGLYGANRRGLAEELGVAGSIDVQMGTLGKALGASGGYICGSRRLVDYLINRSRSLIFSTAPVPAAAAAATAGIRFVQSAKGAERCRLLWQRVAEVLGRESGLPQATDCPRPLGTSAILPIMIGDEVETVSTAAKLRQLGIFIPAIRYPTVARGAARLRLTLTAAHTTADIQQLMAALGGLNLALRPSHFAPRSHAPAG